MAMAEVESGKLPRKKAPTFTKAEEALLLEEYERRRVILECSKGTNTALAAKRRAWEEIAASLNSFNINAVRSWEDIRRKYKNILQSGKKKTDSNTGTGGGPTQVLTEAEEKAISLNEGQDNLVGLQSGIDSAASFDDFHPVTIMDLGLKILENGTIATEISNAPTTATKEKPEAETKEVDAWQAYLQSKIESKNVLLPLQTKFYQSAAKYFDTQTELAKVKIKLANKRLQEE